MGLGVWAGLGFRKGDGAGGGFGSGVWGWEWLGLGDWLGKGAGGGFWLGKGARQPFRHRERLWVGGRVWDWFGEWVGVWFGAGGGFGDWGWGWEWGGFWGWLGGGWGWGFVGALEGLDIRVRLGFGGVGALEGLDIRVRLGGGLGGDGSRSQARQTRDSTQATPQQAKASIQSKLFPQFQEELVRRKKITRDESPPRKCASHLRGAGRGIGVEHLKGIPDDSGAGYGGMESILRDYHPIPQIQIQAATRILGVDRAPIIFL